jgi:hypothetical protein
MEDGSRHIHFRRNLRHEAQARTSDASPFDRAIIHAINILSCEAKSLDHESRQKLR